MLKQFKTAVDYFNALILNDLPAEAMVAGGVGRNFFMTAELDLSNDIDLYFKNKNAFNQVCLYFEDKGELVFENENTRRYEVDGIPLAVDCIKKFHKTPANIIADFDFTINGIVISKTAVHYHDTFFVDLASRQLILNRTEKLHDIFARIYRLIHIGFDISNHELQRVVDTQKKLYNDRAKGLSFTVKKFYDEFEDKEFEAVVLDTDEEVGMWLEMAYSQVCLDIYRHIESNGIQEPRIKAEIIEDRGSSFEIDRNRFMEKRYPHGQENDPETVYINDQQEMFDFDETRFKEISIKEEEAVEP